jgi:hypothetical protein
MYKLYIIYRNKNDTKRIKMTSTNPFAKASEEAQEEVAVQKTETKANEVAPPAGRKIISEETVSDSNWLNLPGSKAIDEQTPFLKIAKDGYYNQEGRKMKNKTTGEEFYTALESGKGPTYKDHGEFIVEGMVDGNKYSLRLSNWECKIKMDALVRYCRANNFTLANQSISFKRVNSGQQNSGNNWELHCETLKLTISGPENKISQF